MTKKLRAQCRREVKQLKAWALRQRAAGRACGLDVVDRLLKAGAKK